MNNVKDSLKAIEDLLRQAIISQEHNKSAFAELKRSFNCGGDEVGIEHFDQLDLFDKYDSENINESRKIDSHGNLVKAEMHLDSVLNNLEDVGRKLMSHLKAVDQEMNAIKTVKAFIKYWDNKLLDDYELKNYPAAFKKCFSRIPDDKRDEIARLISGVKQFSNEDSDARKIVLNESNKSNAALDNLPNPIANFVASEAVSRSSRSSNVSSTSGLSLSDVSLPGDLKKAIPKGAKIYAPGHTADLGTSVLDFTMLDKCRDISGFPTVTPEDDLNGSAGSDGLLNQAIHNIEEEDDYEDNTNGAVGGLKRPLELPSFLDDSARIPEIEHATTDCSWSQVNFDIGSNFYCNRDSVLIDRSIQENSERADESMISAFFTDRSMQQQTQLDCSHMEESAVDFDYSFNRTPPRPGRY